MAIDNEEKLLSRLSEGDAGSFAALYKYYAPMVYRYLHKFLKSSELSDDLTQEVFAGLWEKHETLQQVNSFKAFLFTSSKNAALNYLKRAAIDNVAKGVILQAYPVSDQHTEDRLITADYMDYLDKQLQKLTPQSREVFRLCRQEYKTYDEAAAILGISRNAVKKHMVKTMKTLGEAVERDLGISLATLIICMLLSGVPLSAGHCRHMEIPVSLSKQALDVRVAVQ